MNKDLTIIAITYDHASPGMFTEGRKLRIFLDCLLEQHIHEKSWKYLFAHDGSRYTDDPSPRQSYWHTYNQVSEYIKEFPNEFQFYYCQERQNAWGHNLRDQCLELVETPYVHFTNCDNLYNYGWLERVLPVLRREEPDLLYWPCSHSYSEFDYFDPSLSPGHIDFCNYILKTDKAKQLGFPWRHREADGAQIETFMQTFPDSKVVKMTGVFSTHH